MGNEWRGRKFLLISLAVTTVSIIFFFALRLIFPTIKESAAEWQKIVSPIMQRVIDWGGVKVQSVEVTVLAKEGERDFFSREKSLESIRKALNVYYGQPFWWISLESIQRMVMESGWARSVYIRRAFPSTIQVHLEPREPRFILRAREGWALADAEGFFITQTDEIPGWLAHLPIVTGMQNVLTSKQTAVELNRSLQKERQSLEELSRLIDQIESRLTVKVQAVEMGFDEWEDAPLFTLNWVSLSGSVQQDFRVTFLGGHWEKRLSALQFVLSEAKMQKSSVVRILGQFEDRWILAADERGGR